MIDRYVDTEELRRLAASLVVVLGALMIFVLFAFIVVPGLRNANKPMTSPSGSPQIGETGWLDPTEFPPQKSYEIPPVDPETVLVANSELLERGEELYVKSCAQCHGETGQGDGPASTGLMPQPRNFAEADGWKNGYQLPDLFKTLSEGIEGASMASFSFLRKTDRMALAHHVQSLTTFPREPVDEKVLQALSEEIASKGETVPNKIPVSMAMASLEEEFTAPTSPVLPAADDKSPHAELLRRAFNDPERAALTLAGISRWRDDIEVLSQVLTSGAPENGFSISVAVLPPEEWQALQAALMIHFVSLENRQ